MKSHIRLYLLALVGALAVSCASKPFAHYGAANDRTGTNGITNGNGKIVTR
jgi:hypothetical protein